MANRRIYYAIQQLQIAPDTTTVYTSDHVVHGLQSIGINTRFNLEQIFEIGQLAIYQNVEALPDIEVTGEKVLDGYPLLYHLSTPTAVSASLAGRSVDKCQLLMSIYADTKDSASGSPISEVEMSGMFISQLGYNFQVNGPFTESVTWVGNNKQWRNSAFSSTGHFPLNNDTPLADSGVQLRQHILFGSGNSILPPTLRGITSVGGGSGYNIETSGIFGASIQSIRISTNFGRDNLLELGRKAPYFRPLQFPVQVQTTMEAYCKDGDQVTALENADNTTEERIKIMISDSTIIDLGSHNRLESVQYGNANASRNSSNATCTYTYTTFNDMFVTHDEDPAGL